MQETESERQCRVIDMMLSMHSTLRDRYNRRELFLNCSLLAASVILNAFVFVDDATLKTIGFEPSKGKMVIGLASIAVFLISIIELRVDWAGVANEHGVAVEKLSNLKGKYRLHFESEAKNDVAAQQKIIAECAGAMAELTPIREADFIRLKHRHLKKKLLSKMVSENPGVPLSHLKSELRRQALKKLADHG